MKVKGTVALITAVLIYVLLGQLQVYLEPLLPEVLKGLSMAVILFIAAKIIGNILEFIFTRTTEWMEGKEFSEEMCLFAFLGLFSWLLLTGAQRFIGGEVRLVYIPPVAYFLINWLYREGRPGDDELV